MSCSAYYRAYFLSGFQQHMHAQGARVPASSRGSNPGGSVPLLETQGELHTHLPVSLPLSGANPVSVAGVTVLVGGTIPFGSQIPNIVLGITGEGVPCLAVHCQGVECNNDSTEPSSQQCYQSANL